MENHHESIISREDFKIVKTIMEQRKLEKNIDGSDGKYQKRYVFSEKLYCVNANPNL